MPQKPEVENDDGADEQLEDQQELSLSEQVGLAGFIDQLGDIQHRPVHRHVLQLLVNHQAEQQSKDRYDDAAV